MLILSLKLITKIEQILLTMLIQEVIRLMGEAMKVEGIRLVFLAMIKIAIKDKGYFHKGEYKGCKEECKEYHKDKGIQINGLKEI